MYTMSNETAPTSVFHVVILTGDMLSIAGMATFGSRSDADRIAAWFRAGLVARYVAENGSADLAYRSRVGVLEMPQPDPRLGHPAPYTAAEVDAWIAAGPSTWGSAD